jgi:UDP:flavonoid glycosyltransferase YjiC (YdhE family)
VATILIWMSPEAGHTIPSIKIASDLRQRNHKVVYLTCGKICQELASLGFDTRTFLPSDWRELAARRIFGRCRPALQMYGALERRFHGRQEFRAAIRDEIQRAAIAIGADLVVVDGVHDTWLKMYRVMQNHCRVARLYVHLPYKPLPVEDVHAELSPRIYLSPKQFELPEYICESAHYTEPALYVGPYSSTDSFDWSTLNPDVPLVYCSLGSQMVLYSGTEPFLRHMLAAAAALPGYQFVINAGPLIERLVASPEVNNVAHNVSLVPFVPHPEVLSKATVAIVHGGFGVIKECIWFGVPMLIVPHKWDQPLNAVRVAYHGLGFHLDVDKMSDKLVAEAVRVLATNASIKNRLQQMREVFLASENHHETARICSEFLQTRLSSLPAL